MIATEAAVRRALEDGTMTLTDVGHVATFGAFLCDIAGLPTAARDRTPAQQRRFLRAYFRHYSEEPTVSETAARAIVRERSSGRCEIAIPSVCRGAATEFSHRVRRARGGLWLPSNGLDSCSGCHGWVNGRPILAEAAGLDYLPPHALAWPAWCEPFGWHRGWWHPRDDGTWTECATLAAWPVCGVARCDSGCGTGNADPWDADTWADMVVCERPDAWEEQQRAHASLCTGLGACAA